MGKNTKIVNIPRQRLEFKEVLIKKEKNPEFKINLMEAKIK